MALSVVIQSNYKQDGTSVANSVHATLHNATSAAWNDHFDPASTFAGPIPSPASMWNTGVTRLGNQTYSAADMWGIAGLGLAIAGPDSVGVFAGKAAGTPVDGNWVTAPAPYYAQPTTIISRHEYIPSANADGLNNALWIFQENHADTGFPAGAASLNQPIAINTYVRSRGDGVGLNLNVTNFGDASDHPSVAFGVFAAVAGSSTLLGNVNPGGQAFSGDVNNDTGTDHGWADTSRRFAGVDLNFRSTGGKKNGIGVQVRGVAIAAGFLMTNGASSVEKAGFWDSSDAPTILGADQTHAGPMIDFSAATVSGGIYAQWDSNYSHEITGGNPYIYFDKSGASLDSINYSRASNLFGFTIGGVAKVVISGTPGAGNTNLYLTDSAGSLRQVKIVNSGGNDFLVLT